MNSQRISHIAGALGATLAFSSCVFVIGGRHRSHSDGQATKPVTTSATHALDASSASHLLAHIEVLASDEFQGRAPGTVGEEKTVAYLTRHFRVLGAAPGNPDGTYVQKVPLVGLAAEPSGGFEVAGKIIPLAFPKDAVAASRRQVPSVRVDGSDVVFVGYGVVAPEYGWDDYKDVDVKGKTIVMLVNDPAVPDASDTSKLDERVFKGRAMTYYGRWTYKYEIAAAKGAAAALIVHEDGPAGYPWGVVEGSFGRENFDIVTPDKNMSRAEVEGWIQLEKAKELFAACGHDFAALKQAACTREFRPVALGAKARFAIDTKLRTVDSQNVVALLPGTDPKRKDELVVYTAHWDHLGVNEKLEGDQIFNGAIDNASGTSALLEIAGMFQRDGGPRRSVLFLAVTAEEKGLLGSRYYAAHPLYPLERTVAVINMDALGAWGRTEDVISIGLGHNTLDAVLEDAARAQGRTVRGDSEPVKGIFYRSDHFEFAKQGVPALYADSGEKVRGKPGFGEKKRQEYTSRDYHKVSDDVKSDWDLAGMVEDLALLYRVGRTLADGDLWPEWNEGSEFKARRDAMMNAVGQN
ncbi:MAG: M28 family metallopeptidase [Planctomycetota bacterium]